MNGGAAQFRAWTCIGFAFLLCLSGALSFFEEYTTAAERNPDPWAIARQQVRYAALRAELPRNSMIGYFSDVPPGKGGGSVALFATAYSLAPHLVAQDTPAVPPELVVGNFRRLPDLEQLRREQGLTLVKDYGRGVMLFRRERK